MEIAILETARGGSGGGLGYDLADVAVVTNIGSDHLGQDGIEKLRIFLGEVIGGGSG